MATAYEAPAGKAHETRAYRGNADAALKALRGWERVSLEAAIPIARVREAVLEMFPELRASVR